MDRLTGNQAKSLMEAYAQVYVPSQSGKQLLSEQQIPLPSWLNGMSIDEYNKKYIEKYKSGVFKPPLKPGETPYDRALADDRRDVERFGSTASGEPADRVRARTAQSAPARPAQSAPARPAQSAPATAPAKTFKVGDKQMTKAEINKEYNRLRSSKDPKERARATQFGKDANRAIFKPATATTAGGTKFERRTPTSAELAAARKAGGGDPGINAAVKTGTLNRTTSTPAQNASPNGGKSPTGTGSVQGSSLRQEIDAVRDRIQQSGTNSIPPQQQPGPTGPIRLQTVPFNQNTSKVPTGDTVKTAVNPDSSLRLTQRRTPEATRKIKQGLELASADLFDIVKGEFINEGYSEEDTMYMMANLNEEQLQEFLRHIGNFALKHANKIPAVRGIVNKVGRMFGRKPVPTQVPAGQVGALRLYQDKANQSIQRLNQQTTRLNNRAATRATQREADRLNNLDPRAVGERNAREAGAQIRARNERLGRPVDAAPQPVDRLNYKPGDPMFDDYVRRQSRQSKGWSRKVKYLW